jgi:hypothetical protein
MHRHWPSIWNVSGYSPRTIFLFPVRIESLLKSGKAQGKSTSTSAFGSNAHTDRLNSMADHFRFTLGKIMKRAWFSLVACVLFVLGGMGIAVAAEGRFSYKAEGAIVVDAETGLEWMRCAMGQQWNPDVGDCTGEASSYSWSKALELSSDVGGHTDWRLPGKDELNTLVLCSSGQRAGYETEGMFAGNGGRCQGDFAKPTIDQSAFPSTPHKEAYWTRDKLDTTAVRHSWVVGFGTGYVNDIARGAPYPYARLVRP